MYKLYKSKLCSNTPEFLNKYLDTPSLNRLKKVGYFCGMDYASDDVYSFSEYISRFDHSLSVALLVYKLTKDKEMTLAGLFHDVGTPCFSHVIDYMNGDFEKQESTEEYTESIIKGDRHLLECLDSDGIDIDKIIDFKRYPIVDNDRPKVCADRIDGLILTAIGWTQNISCCDIIRIVDSMEVYTNEFGEDEIGFKCEDVAKQVVFISETIDRYCHSNFDNFMMTLLARITKEALDSGYVSYDDLFRLDEETLFSILETIPSISDMLYDFMHIRKDDIPFTPLENVKVRNLKPLVGGVRVV